MTDETPVATFDGHNDLLLRLADREDPAAVLRGESEGLPDTHLDLPRAREAGLRAGGFASFVPSADYPEREETAAGYRYPLPDRVDHDRARRVVDDHLDCLATLAREVDGFLVATTVADVEAALASGREPGVPPDLAAVPHLEGAEAVAPDRSNLGDLYDRGVRSLGPVWSRPNAFGEGVRVEYPGHPDTGGGLTDAGRGLLRDCEEMGILVDLAHATERAFYDAAEVLDGPLVVSHAGARGVCRHSRNLTDGMLDAVADSGGLVGITFAAGQVAADRETATGRAILDHVEYVADRVGVDHVALGSDFDGAATPEDVGDVTGLPSVVEGLRERGIEGEDLLAVARGNWLRVLRAAWTE